MALVNYGPDSTNLTIGGIPIENFGETDPPIQVEDVENSSMLKRGIGGTSIRLDNLTNPKRLTVNLIPGAIEARQLIALAKTGADLTFSLTVNGSNEKVAGFDGILETTGSKGRGGKTSVSDESLVFMFADSEET